MVGNTISITRFCVQNLKRLMAAGSSNLSRFTNGLLQLMSAGVRGTRRKPVRWRLPIFILLGIFSNSAYGQDIDTLNFRLSRAAQGFTLLHTQHPPFSIPQAWLIPPEEVEEDKESYVTSFNYDESVSAFPIGGNVIGLHLSSYETQRQGSAMAAAGRDVFLVLDLENGTLHPGQLGLGITKGRVRSMGCLAAESHSFMIADIDGDRRIDIGATKEEIRCETYDEKSKVGAAAIEAHHPRQWYIFSKDHWKYNPEYDGRLPMRGMRKLPLIGQVKSSLDFVRELMNRN